jgi:hypothetical protein
MARTRRNSSDSIVGQAQLLRTERPEWPADAPVPEDPKRRDEVVKRFNTLVELRANEWTRAELQLLCVIARLSVLRDESLAALESEGLTIWGGKNGGTKCRNPAVETSQSLNAQISSLMGKLHLLVDVDPRSLANHASKARQFDAQNRARDESGLSSLLA